MGFGDDPVIIVVDHHNQLLSVNQYDVDRGRRQSGAERRGNGI